MTTPRDRAVAPATFALSFEIDFGSGPKHLGFRVPHDAPDADVRTLFDLAFEHLTELRRGPRHELPPGITAIATLPTPGAS